MRSPKYGELQSRTIPHEAYKIWLTRDEEEDGLSSGLVMAQMESTSDEPANDPIFYSFISKMIDKRVRDGEKNHSHLNDREVKVIGLRYWADMTLDEVGDMLGVSKERVRQIEQNAFRKIRFELWCHQVQRKRAA